MVNIAYTPVASVTNVDNNANPNGGPAPGQDATTGNVPISNIHNPDDFTGSNSIATTNENQSIVVTSTSVNGRFDNFTVINNPA